MKMPTEWLGETAQGSATDAYRNKVAPVVLWGCAGSLAAGEDPEFAMAEGQVIDKQTRWRLLWVAKTRIAYIDATKDRDDWTAYVDDPDGGDIDDLEAWAMPRTAMTKVSLDSASTRHVRGHGEFGRSGLWKGVPRITFEGGIEITLPLFGQHRSNEHETLVTEVVAALAVAPS